MKTIIVSPDALVNSNTNQFFNGIIETLEAFINSDPKNRIYCVSINKNKLDVLPEFITQIHLPINLKRFRAGRGLINLIQDKKNIELKDIYVIGSKDVDMHLAYNSKVIFLNAFYSRINNPNEKIFSKKYGIIFHDTDKLHTFLTYLSNLNNPWYCKLDLRPNYKIMCLINADTLIPNRTKNIASEFRKLLKNNDTSKFNEISMYTLIAINRIIQDFSKIDYVGYYPSSNTQENKILSEIKERVRQTFTNQRLNENILIRNTSSIKRHITPKHIRIKQGCAEQFNTININRKYMNKIVNRNICIIDDFTNIGSSSETVRALFNSAGVSKVLFIALGKFGTRYIEYNYQISGDIYKCGYQYTLTNVSYNNHNFEINKHYSEEILNSLARII